MAKPTRCRGKWRIRWSDETGRRRSEVYDDYRTAQKQLSLRQAHAEEVRRGLRAPTPPDKTVHDICDYWVAKRAPRKRSRKDDESIIRLHLRPAFGHLKLKDLSDEHVDEYEDAKSHLADKTVANHLTLLITMLNKAKRLGWLERVPKITKPSVRAFSRDYRYLRTEDEIRRFLAAARDEGENVYSLYSTAVYNGMRAGELAGLRWDDVDLDRRLITVQRSFDGPTKAGYVRYVPVLDPLLPLLRSWRLRHPGRLVFTNRDGNMLRESGRIFQEVLHRVLSKADLEPWTDDKGRRRHYVTFHGLRHYAESGIMPIGPGNPQCPYRVSSEIAFQNSA